MQNTSALYKELIALDVHWFETQVIIEDAGTFGEDQLFSVNTTLALFQDAPKIGMAISSEIEIRMLMPDDPIPTIAMIQPFVRVCGNIPIESNAYVDADGYLVLPNAEVDADGYLVLNEDEYCYVDYDGILVFENSEVGHSEWLPQGVYFVDTREVTHNDDGLDILTIHGYDAMLKAENDYPSTNHVWPYKDILVVNEIAQAIGVSVDSRVANFMTIGYMINLPAGYSMRETLEQIASAYAGNFCISPEGKLVFVPIYGYGEDFTGNYLAVENGDALVFGNEGWYILV